MQDVLFFDVKEESILSIFFWIPVPSSGGKNYLQNEPLYLNTGLVGRNNFMLGMRAAFFV